MTQSNNIADIMERLSEADRILVAEKIAGIDRKLEQIRKFDAAVADSLVRVLKSPLGKELRRKLKEIIANERD